MIGDVEFNGDLGTCYKEIMGLLQSREDTLPNTMAQSPKTGVYIVLYVLFGTVLHFVSKSFCYGVFIVWESVQIFLECKRIFR